MTNIGVRITVYSIYWLHGAMVVQYNSEVHFEARAQ